MEALTEVERRRCHVPDQAKVGANVVSEELSCGNLVKIPDFLQLWPIQMKCFVLLL